MERKKNQLKNLSVEAAVKRGEFWLLAVPLFIALAGLILGVLNWTTSDDAVWIKILDLLFLMICPALVFRSLAVTKWKIRAFGRVRNVHELKRKAKKEGLIFPDDSWLTGLEWKTPLQKEKLRSIELRFTDADDMNYGDLYPENTEVSKSWFRIFKTTAAVLVFLTAGVILFARGEVPVAILCFVLTLPLLYMDRKVLMDGFTPLRIGEEGIYLNGYGLTKWDDIRDEEIQSINLGRGDTSWLNFYRKSDSGKAGFELHRTSGYDMTEEELFDEYISYDISYLRIEPDELAKILKVYRKRHMKTE